MILRLALLSCRESQSSWIREELENSKYCSLTAWELQWLPFEFLGWRIRLLRFRHWLFPSVRH